MISICIATYNGEQYIRQQINSILEQLSMEDEIIVSDDGSTDGTIDVINSLNDTRIKVYHANCHSPVFNFENAIKQASGDYIFLADQDDVWCKEKVKTIIPRLEEYDLVFSNAVVVDKNLNVTRNVIYDNKPRYDISGTLYRNSFIGCTMAFRKEMKEVILPFPKKLPMHDIWIALSVQMFGKVYYIDEGLILYRRHGDNLTDDKISDFSYLYRIEYRLYLIWQMAKRYIKLKCSVMSK